MKLLREYIRTLLTEGAMGPEDLPEGAAVVISAPVGGEVKIYIANSARPDEFFKKKETWPSGNSSWTELGEIYVGPLRDGDAALGQCDGAWRIGYSNAYKGWGPMMYDLAMEYATIHGNGLMSDRHDVSASARGVWDYYLANRGDTTPHQLDDLENTLTPVEEDNCDMDAIKFPGRGQKKELDWVKSPLSKRYTKAPTTMNRLRALGKLVEL